MFIQEDMILELEKRIRKEPPKQINLLGGEPTLHPKALEIGRSLYNCGTSIGLSTNGLWNRKFRKEFERIEYPIETEITFLGWHHYSPNQKKELIETFEQLRQKGGVVSIGAIIDSDNFNGIEHLDIAEKYHFELR